MPMARAAGAILARCDSVIFGIMHSLTAIIAASHRGEMAAHHEYFSSFFGRLYLNFISRCSSTRL